MDKWRAGPWETGGAHALAPFLVTIHSIEAHSVSLSEPLELRAFESNSFDPLQRSLFRARLVTTRSGKSKKGHQTFPRLMASRFPSH